MQPSDSDKMAGKRKAGTDAAGTPPPSGRRKKGPNAASPAEAASPEAPEAAETQVVLASPGSAAEGASPGSAGWCHRGYHRVARRQR